MHRSHHIDAIHQLLRSDFTDMLQALSLNKALTKAGSLQLDLPHEMIVKQTNVSLRQVQRIKYNLIIHGSIHKPKVIQQGRKSKTMPEMEEVSV